jgi:hypothetical protein
MRIALQSDITPPLVKKEHNIESLHGAYKLQFIIQQYAMIIALNGEDVKV